MAKTSLTNQPWKSAIAEIAGLDASAHVNTTLTATLSVAGLDLRAARIVWEAEGEEPVFGQSFVFKPLARGPFWVEAEAQLPDGRRVFATKDFTVK
jgi:hypothetical protein